jgi:hypothetical protein
MSVVNDTTCKRFKPSIIRIRDLIFNELKEDVWPLSLQSIVNLKYIIAVETVDDPLAFINFNEYNSISAVDEEKGDISELNGAKKLDLDMNLFKINNKIGIPHQLKQNNINNYNSLLSIKDTYSSMRKNFSSPTKEQKESKVILLSADNKIDKAPRISK